MVRPLSKYGWYIMGVAACFGYYGLVGAADDEARMSVLPLWGCITVIGLVRILYLDATGGAAVRRFLLPLDAALIVLAPVYFALPLPNFISYPSYVLIACVAAVRLCRLHNKAVRTQSDAPISDDKN